MKKFSPLLLISLFMLGLIGCSDDKIPEKNNDSKAISISAVKPTPQALTIQQSAIGSIESLQSPTVAAEISGTVFEILIDVGQAVKINQPLAILDDELEQIALGQAKAEQVRIEALLKNQQLSTERVKSLVDKGTQPQSILDESQAQLDALQAQLHQAKLSIEQSEYRLAKTIIRSPVSGFVQQRLISIGDYVSPSTAAFTLVTSDKLRAILKFPETILPSLKTGQAVRLKTPTVPRVVDAKISEISPKLDPNSRAGTVIIDFNNPGGFQAGASVFGQVTIKHLDKALFLPQQAIVRRPQGHVVYLIKENQVKEQIVTVGVQKNKLRQVITGIEANSLVANTGAGFLTDGAKVSIK